MRNQKVKMKPSKHLCCYAECMRPQLRISKQYLIHVSSFPVLLVWWFGIASTMKIIGWTRYIGHEKSLSNQRVFLRNSLSLYFQVFLRISLFFTHRQAGGLLNIVFSADLIDICILRREYHFPWYFSCFSFFNVIHVDHESVLSVVLESAEVSVGLSKCTEVTSLASSAKKQNQIVQC